MKKQAIYLLTLATFGCNTMEEPGMQVHQVSFGELKVESFQNNNPNARMQAEDWSHVFERYARLNIVNNANGEEYLLEFDPNDFEHPYNINLMEGEYTATASQEGNGIQATLPFTVEETFTVGEDRVNLSLNAETTYGLVTVSSEFLESAALIMDGERYELVRTTDRENYFTYAPGGSEVELQIIDHFDQDTVRRDLTVGTREHYHFFLYIPEPNGRVQISSQNIKEF